jgi:hypothetical protein
MTDIKVKGHLVITVAEASGKNKEDQVRGTGWALLTTTQYHARGRRLHLVCMQVVWDPNFVEGFVKGTPSVTAVLGATKRTIH